MEVVSSASGGEQKSKIWQILEQEPHRVFAAEALAATLKPAAAKDPNQQQQFASDILADLNRLVQEGKIREVADGLFKTRLFTNRTKQIEHAFIGGMGNTLFRFRSPIFRLNIGVIAMFFIRSQGEGNWMLLVRDTTAGTSYCLRMPLQDGSYRFGSEASATEKDYIPIVGRYIEKHHVTVTLRGEDINVEDQKTGRGTRVDLLTEEGLARYREAAAEFLKVTDRSEWWDPFSRGRYVLDQLLRHKKDFETTFFSAAVDAALLQNNSR
jgi:hypothetical protein